MTTFSDLLTFTRSGSATYVDSTGTLQTAADGEPRIGHHVYENGAWVNKGIRLESESRTNHIPNNTMQGATVGVIGSGGALPTGWTLAGMPAGTAEIISLAPKNGKANIQLRLNGTPTGTVFLTFVGSNVVSASAGESWTSSAWLQAVSGDTTNITRASLGISGRDSSLPIEAANGADITGILTTDTRHSVSLQLTEAGIISVNTYLRIINSGAIDITLDVGLPQMEQAELASSPIETSGSAVTRSGESATVPAAKLPDISNGGTIYIKGTVDYADNDSFQEAGVLRIKPDGDSQLYLKLDTFGSATGRWVWQAEVAGSFYNVLTPADSVSPGLGVPFAIAVTFDGSEIAMTVNGISYGPDAIPSLPDFSGNVLKIGNEFQGTIDQIRIWDELLDQSDRENLTS